MKFGFSLANNQGFEDVQDVLRLAVRAEELGFDSVWAGDHVFMTKLWTQQDPSFEGRFHSSSGMKFSPKPDPTYL